MARTVTTIVTDDITGTEVKESEVTLYGVTIDVLNKDGSVNRATGQALFSADIDLTQESYHCLADVCEGKRIAMITLLLESELGTSAAKAVMQWVAGGDREALRTFLARDGVKTTRSKPASATANRERNSRIRDWAKANGYGVKDRGAIPANIVAEYESATGDK
jgi:hypothetical protein